MKSFTALIVLVTVAAFRSVNGQETLKVPQGNGTPVMIDGKFSDGEWQDAAVKEIAPSIHLYLKQYKGNVFLGLKATTPFKAYVDLFLCPEAGKLFNLHASMQLGERVLSGNDWTDTEPPTQWGNETDWTASRSKFDPLKDRELPVTERLFPYDGKEFQLRRARFKGRRWRVRIEVRDLAGTHPTIAFPSNSERFKTDRWAVLNLE
jgi:hypothetical protein